MDVVIDIDILYLSRLSRRRSGGYRDALAKEEDSSELDKDFDEHCNGLRKICGVSSELNRSR